MIPTLENRIRHTNKQRSIFGAVAGEWQLTKLIRRELEVICNCIANPVRSPLFFSFLFILFLVRYLSGYFLVEVSVVHVGLGSQRATPTSKICVS